MNMKSLFKTKIGDTNFTWLTDNILNELKKNGFEYYVDLYHPVTAIPDIGYQLSYFGTDVYIYENVIITFKNGWIQQQINIDSFIEAFNKIEI